MPSNVRVVISVNDGEARKATQMAEVMTSPEFFSLFLRTKVADYFRKRVTARFATEGDRASGRWQPLTEATINIRESEGYAPGPINVRGGDLKRAMTSARGYGRRTMDGAELEWPSRSDLNGPQVPEKFAVAQAGSPPQGYHGATPARPVAASGAEDLRDIVDLLGMELKMALEHGMNITVNTLESDA